MLRVLTLSTLFPDHSRSGFGGFVERQTLGLAAHPDVDVRVVAPIAVPPTACARRHPAYREISELPAHETWKGLHVYRPQFPTLPMIGGRINPWSIWWTLLPLLDEVRQEFQFDVIDAEFFFPDGPAAVRLGRRYGVPVSIKARGSDIHLWGNMAASRRMIVAAGREADGLLAVSAALRDDMIAMGMPGDRVTVHHTGVDHSAFCPRDRAAAKAALGVEGLLVVTAGNLIALKGQALLIEAIRALPAATLLIAGHGPDHDTLAAQIAGVNSRGGCACSGRCPTTSFPAFWQRRT